MRICSFNDDWKKKIVEKLTGRSFVADKNSSIQLPQSVYYSVFYIYIKSTDFLPENSVFTLNSYFKIWKTAFV